MFPGDTLVMYTDGVTESVDATGDDFGEDRLVDVLLRHRHLNAHGLMKSIVHEVRAFSTSEQHDGHCHIGQE
jgi:phosphoserine phosphatase RsbU/P